MKNKNELNYKKLKIFSKNRIKIKIFVLCIVKGIL